MESQEGNPKFLSFCTGISSNMAIMAATSKGMMRFLPKYNKVKTLPVSKRIFVKLSAEMSIFSDDKRFVFKN
ncbi:hypothetical protein [Lacinutrix sp. 5H-3-7-4]|uniref:hypothetical protein n=1 Tax=Lacinutrix sp. (strain 5H-3-7-4) TaxID=983544 RepID=UPI0002E47AB4|nr:hypothetical protein [Lacinutrix sp. 5H-3-7-4]